VLPTTVYWTNFLVSNTHSLLHVADNAKKYGPLDSVSCFPFGTLEKIVRRPQNPVQQIARRL